MSKMTTDETFRALAAADRRNAVRGVAWGGIESVASAIVGFLLTPLVVAAFGIEGLGLWAASWSMAHAAGLFDLGMSGAYARFTAQAIARGDARALNGTVAVGVGFHLVVTALLAGAAVIAGPSIVAALSREGHFKDVAPSVFGCAMATVLLRLALSVFRGVVAGAQRIDVLGRIGAGVAVLEGLGAAAIVLSGGGLRGMGFNSLAAALVASVLEGRAAYRLCPQLRLRPFRAPASDWREVLSFGLKVQMTRAAEILAKHVPRLALAAGPGLAVAGVYDLGARVAAALSIAGALPLPVLAPLASRLEARSETHRLLPLLERSTRYVALIVVPCAAVVMVDAGGILRAWTGQPEPPGAGATARLLAAATMLALLASPLRLVLRGIGHAGLEASSAISASTLHLILALALAVRFQAPGVAWGGFVASVVAAAILGVGARRVASGLFARSVRRCAAGPFLAGLAGLAAGWAFNLIVAPPSGLEAARLPALIHLVGESAVVLTVFALVAAGTGGVRREDLALLRVARGGT
ncbi:MAG: oligosaccharide flippase family protein [Acidobacteria bacterium]|nr:oligosaccharide flippase family protein [Acidobacteriota bacterium]